MRVLIVNKFYYPSGGDFTVVERTRRLLKGKGHDVKIFAMEHPRNLTLPEKDFFASPVDLGGNIFEGLKGLARMIGKGDIRRTVSRLLDTYAPTVVHLHNVHSYLSPIVGELAAKRGIKTVWTLHDYKLVCPAYTLKRRYNNDCRLCVNGSKINVIKYRCIKNSSLRSLGGWLEALKWNKSRLQAFTDTFLCPSEFLYEIMLEAGFDKEKLQIVHNFIEDVDFSESINRRSGFCYVGRLAEEKGLLTLMEAAQKAGVHLKVAGQGPLFESLRNRYGSFVEFLGHLDREHTIKLFLESEASVLPSEWNENNPMSAIESLACGCPVIASDIGGIPEIIGKDGALFTAGEIDTLKKILETWDPASFDSAQISKKTKARFSARKHYDHLMKIYTS